MKTIVIMYTRKITQTLLLLGTILMQNQVVRAQQLEEKTALRFYEHHSSTKTDAPFGNSANGDQSAYDFIKHDFVNSFNSSTFRAYPLNSTIPANIDMVEHNGPFGNGGGFGFTSSESTIWAQMGPPYIRGNDQTLFFLAPSTFDYDKVTQMSEIKNSFNESRATKSITAVAEGSVYLAKLRNSDKYIAIKITGVKDWNGTEGNDDVYFNFNYKYAAASSGVTESTSAPEVFAYPNPAMNELNIQFDKPQNWTTLSIYNISGQLQYEYTAVNENTVKLDIHNLQRGVYYIRASEAGNATVKTFKFIKL